MKILLETFLFTWILLKSTVAIEEEQLSHNWTTAWNVCEMSKHFLLPDLGLDGFNKSGIFDDFEVEVLVWLNAKDVEIIYTSSTVHVKLAYLPADSNVTSYICYNANGLHIHREHNLSLILWDEANNKCKNTYGGTLLNISSARQAKITVTLLKKGDPSWVDKMIKGRIPNIVSETSNTDEMCLGVMKMADGNFTYRRDNCTQSHRFVCIPSIDIYAPAITEIIRPYPVYSSLIQLGTEAVTTFQNGTDVSSDDESKTDDIVCEALVIVGVALVIVVCIIITIICLCRRGYCRKSQQNTQMHKNAKKLVNGTLSDGFILSESLQKPNSCMARQMDNEAEHGENEVCVVDCQDYEVPVVRARYSKYPGQLSSRAELEMLPAYMSMNEESVQQVSSEYERYSPNPCHLQQKHCYVSEENQGQLDELGQYDTIPSCKAGLVSEVKERAVSDDYAALL